MAAGQARTDRGVSGVPRHARREGDRVRPARARSTRASSSGPMTTWSARSCPAARSAAPADFNTQLQDWLAMVNTRRRRALGCAPTDRIAADQAAMLALPPVAPATGWRASTRLARDHYVRIDSNDYSVHPGRDRPPDRAGRRSWTGSRRSATAGWSPTTNGSGPGIRPSPIPTMWLRRSCCAANGSRWSGQSPNPRCEQRRLADYDTALGLPDALTAGWRDGQPRPQTAGT